MFENYEHSREAAKIILDKIKSWEDLNAFTLEEADKKFNRNFELVQNLNLR